MGRESGHYGLGSTYIRHVFVVIHLTQLIHLRLGNINLLFNLFNHGLVDKLMGLNTILPAKHGIRLIK